MSEDKIRLRSVSLKELNALSPGTAMEALGIQVTELGADFVTATMPVDHRTKQVHGVLHGGASVLLAETLGSIASHLVIDPNQFRCVGVEINASHLRAATEGLVIGTAKPLRLTRKLHFWEISICNDKQQLVCISRLTVAVLPIT